MLGHTDDPIHLLQGEFWGRRTVHGAADTLQPIGLPGVSVALAPIFDAIAGRAG